MHTLFRIFRMGFLIFCKIISEESARRIISEESPPITSRPLVILNLSLLLLPGQFILDYSLWCTSLITARNFVINFFKHLISFFYFFPYVNFMNGRELEGARVDCRSLTSAFFHNLARVSSDFEMRTRNLLANKSHLECLFVLFASAWRNHITSCSVISQF